MSAYELTTEGKRIGSTTSAAPVASSAIGTVDHSTHLRMAAAALRELCATWWGRCGNDTTSFVGDGDNMYFLRGGGRGAEQYNNAIMKMLLNCKRKTQIECCGADVSRLASARTRVALSARGGRATFRAARGRIAP